MKNKIRITTRQGHHDPIVVEGKLPEFLLILFAVSFCAAIVSASVAMAYTRSNLYERCNTPAAEFVIVGRDGRYSCGRVGQ